MWNNNSGYPGNAYRGPGSYGPPGGPPGGFNTPPNFPSPSGYPPPNGPPPPGPPPPHTGYSPSYGPPAGPPPGPGGFGGPGFNPPPGPPPSAPGGYGFPGAEHHRHGGYAPPPGPPSGYPAPGGPPPIPSRPAPQNTNSGGYGGYQQPAATPMRPPSQQQQYGPGWEGANHQTQHSYFQYSQCTGKRKALCIGINYFKQQGELKGCINDARNVQNFLQRQFGYQEKDIVSLTDDARNPRQIPTRQNIIQAMQWLVADARPNDALFFHYSGHGGQTKDLDGDEADGFDEVIYPVDYKANGHIVDDMMHDIMVKSLPPGCRLTAIFDSCHSGSALDLPYIYSTEGKVKEPNLAAEAGQGLMSAVTSYARGDMSGVFSSVSGLLKTASGSGQKAEKKARATKTSPADVISWSGCKDSQTSADAFEAGQATGAMSFAFMTSLRANPRQSYQQLLISLREILKSKYSQKPQLSSSHPIDTSLLFIC
ncbi:Ca(2+)-dependent cysteine protease [Cerrena zonata]|uniref:Ca(2+)-dependent cysteine protease n=1 Tax=Cerrena zonata TaxID=2478898 RepID=A0AAW0GBL3_9APHY